MAFGWWDFGLEMGLVRKGGDGVGRAKTNASVGVVMLVRFAMLREGLVLTTSVSADMGNWVLANTARASEKNDHAWAPKAN